MSSPERRSVYIEYASHGHGYPESSSYMRGRSLTREASIARIHRLENVDCAYYHHRMKSIEKDLNVTVYLLCFIILN